jgi:hypothetical protein
MDAHPKRRIFINRGENQYQLFSFRQKDDGSIYCASPDFADAKWISYEMAPEGPRLKSTAAVGTGKISLHGTGMTAIRNNDNPNDHKLIIKGNQLLNRKKNEAGARHLFTAFMREPSYLPTRSPAFNRQSDYAIQANEKLKPFVLVFFAVPRQGIKVNFQFSLEVDEMVHVPNDFLGMHGFGLLHHDVIWFAYRTKNMEQWPKHTHFSYHDGHSIPIFIGTGPKVFRLEFRQPQYALEDRVFTINCTQPALSLDTALSQPSQIQGSLPSP